MDTTQRNGGTAGIVGAVLLVLFLILTMAMGMDPHTAGDPAQALAMIAMKRGLWRLVGIVGTLAAAFGIVFTIGLSNRLKEDAPTRASTFLYFATVGLGGYALSSLMQWKGGLQLADYAVNDQVGGGQAWLALHAATGGAQVLGNAFVGAALLIAGWAVIETAALNPIAGWVGVIAGLLSLAGVAASASFPVFLGTIVFDVIWLAWAGVELRRPQEA
ncbi:MAG TPA: DUF4386 family protein [bacterium]|nr:DUF4386 family protein [bacterium]